MNAGMLKLPSELELLNKFVAADKGDITPGRDILVRILGPKSEEPRIVGLLAARQMFLIHEMRIEEGHPYRRHIAESLMNYGCALGKALQTNQFPPEALFITKKDNTRMNSWLFDNGWRIENDGLLYIREID